MLELGLEATHRRQRRLGAGQRVKSPKQQMHAVHDRNAGLRPAGEEGSRCIGLRSPETVANRVWSASVNVLSASMGLFVTDCPLARGASQAQGLCFVRLKPGSSSFL